MIYMLDTDTVIFLMRGLRITDPRSARQERWQGVGRRIFERARTRARAGDHVTISAITVAELEYGARRSTDHAREVEVVRRVLTPFQLLDFDAGECATRYGEVCDALSSAGRPIGSLDTLIASHALAVRAILVTNNTREFARVPGLSLENWARG